MQQKRPLVTTEQQIGIIENPRDLVFVQDCFDCCVVLLFECLGDFPIIIFVGVAPHIKGAGEYRLFYPIPVKP